MVAKKPVLAIDFDGPLGWTGGYKRFFHWLEEQNHRVDWSAWQATHHIIESLPGLTREQINDLANAFHHTEHGKDILIVPKAHEVLQTYQNLFDYVIITARQQRAAELMEWFIEKEYAEIDFKQLYTGRGHKKGQAVTESGARIMLEDNTQEARRIVETAPHVTVILFPTFLPKEQPVSHERIIPTQAYKQGHTAKNDTDKLQALRSAWQETDSILAQWGD